MEGKSEGPKGEISMPLEEKKGKRQKRNNDVLVREY